MRRDRVSQFRIASVVLICAAVTAAPFSVDELPLGTYELFEYNSVANSSAVVKTTTARFTVLTDRVRGALPSFVVQLLARVAVLHASLQIAACPLVLTAVLICLVPSADSHGVLCKRRV